MISALASMDGRHRSDLHTVLESQRPQKISRFNSSSLSLLLNDSTYPFSQGLPGSMNSGFTSNLMSHRRTAVTVGLIAVA